MVKIGIKVSEAMTKNPVTISKETSLPLCARKMLSQNIGAVLIKEKNELIGIITEKDIVENAVAKELNIKKSKVKDIMMTTMITIAPDADLSEAVTIMIRENVRRLPVIKNKKLVGLLTLRDILYAQPKLFEKLYECFIKKKVKK